MSDWSNAVIVRLRDFCVINCAWSSMQIEKRAPVDTYAFHASANHRAPQVGEEGVVEGDAMEHAMLAWPYRWLKRWGGRIPSRQSAVAAT